MSSVRALVTPNILPYLVRFAYNRLFIRQKYYKKLFQDTSHQCQSKVLVFKPA